MGHDRSSDTRLARRWTGWRAWEGRRGETWVVAQVLLIAVYLIVPRWRAAWPDLLRPAALAIGGVLSLSGLGLFTTGALALGRNLTPLPHPKAATVLVERGPYRLVRHPIYGGLCLLAVGLALATAHAGRLTVAAAALAFFAAKARREETWLRHRFAGYDAYAHRTRRLIPWLY
ncbi:MAG: isoprenylcysteine carboxylmethyltransferase family protein [Chloroflexi bacterium]|nr:isoprenylcysteine carboxylmethyltransferase family protein [Chloroflexota bacterium]